MARPTITQWASGNYPAGSDSWSGQPLRVAPIASYFEPNTNAAAQTINHALGTVGDDLSSAMSYLLPTPTVGPNSSSSITTATPYVIVTSAVSANRTYTLSNSGAVAGDVIRIEVQSTYAFTLNVNNAAASLILTLGYSATQDATWADFVYNGSAWILGRSGYPKAFVPNRLIGSGFATKSSSNSQTATTAATDIVGLGTVSIANCATGDIVLVDGSLEFAIDEAFVTSFSLVAAGTGLTFGGRIRQQRVGTTISFAYNTLSLSDRATVTTGGTITVSLQAIQAYVGGAVTSPTYYGNLRVQVYRP